MHLSIGSVTSVGHEVLRREPGYVYYLAGDGYVWRVPTRRNTGGTALRVGNERIVQEPGFTYFLDRDGRVARGKLVPLVNATGAGERDQAPRVPKYAEVVGERIVREPGYLYYIAPDGYVWRTPTKLNGSGTKKRVGTSPIVRVPGYMYLVNRTGYVIRVPMKGTVPPSAPRPEPLGSHAALRARPAPSGSVFATFCPRCGTPRAPGGSFCTKCGFNLRMERAA